MAGVITTLLAASKNISSTVRKGPGRHTYKEIAALQPGESELASPYLLKSHIGLIGPHTDTISSGNFTITIALPNYGVEVTTGNVVFNADAAAIQTLVDTAFVGAEILSTYTAGDVDVAMTGNLTANSATLTFNGASCNGAYATITTANVDLDADKLSLPASSDLGTLNRPCEAFLYHYGLVEPTVYGTVTPHGETLVPASYRLLNEGNINPFSLSPGLIDAVLLDLAVEQDSKPGFGTTTDLAALFRSMIGCV